MKETLFVLFLTLGGEPIEWTPHFTLSECLSVKRKIERNIGTSEMYSCKKETVTLEENNGHYYIIDFVED